MPGPPPSNTNRRSPGPYSQYPPHNNSSNSSREDVRIPDIGGGRAPTPSERNQMNPIIHDERQQHQQQMPPPHQQPNNLPPMSMRQPYKQEETRSPSNPNISSPHQRPSPRTTHPLVPPQQQPQGYDHRLSPRTSHSESNYRYEQQRSPAQRPLEIVDSSNTSSPRSSTRTDYHRTKHEESYSTRLPPKSDLKREDSPHQEKRPEPENYDESAADALLSMGNPQLGQKRIIQHEHEENKKPRSNEPVSDKMDVDSPREETQVEEMQEDAPEEPAQEEPTSERIIEQPVQEEEPKDEEPEEGEVNEQEEGEVKDDEEVEEDKEVAPTAAVAATTAATTAAAQLSSTPKEGSQ